MSSYHVTNSELGSGIIVVPAFMNLYETSSIYLFIFYYFTHCLIRNLITLQYIICWDKTAAVYKILWIDSQHLFQFHSSIIEAGKLKITFSRFPWSYDSGYVYISQIRCKSMKPEFKVGEVGTRARCQAFVLLVWITENRKVMEFAGATASWFGRWIPDHNRGSSTFRGTILWCCFRIHCCMFSLESLIWFFPQIL